MNFESFDQILDYAIEREEEAAELYVYLAEKMERPYMKEVFLDFAHEEEQHKKKLIGIKEGKLTAPAVVKVIDLKISDHLVDIKLGDDLDYQQALVIAMKREKNAFKLYLDLSEKVADDNLRNIFLMLAQEEARHKLRFEIEYDDIMKEN
ncbi:ferritin family protein [bacterium]|nr:ferritin family protein [bacterium]